jgi:subtilisin family serine protease
VYARCDKQPQGDGDRLAPGERFMQNLSVLVSKQWMRATAAMVLVAGLAHVQPCFAQAGDQSPAKKQVTTAADLPVHVYKIEGAASEFLVSDAPFKAFLEEVKGNVLGTLTEYEIKDATTLRRFTALEMQIAMLENRFDDVPALIERMRGLETKESSRIITGLTILSYLDAKKKAGNAKPGEPDFDAAFEQAISARVQAMPWEKVADDVKAMRGRAQTANPGLVIGSVKASLDPVVEQNKGELSSDLAEAMVSMRVSLDKTIALQPSVNRALSKIISEKSASVQRIDRWSPSVYQLAPDAKASPVIVGIWDSGVDVSVFSQEQLWTNTKETANGKDEDGNGFIDDVHGIAFGLDSQPVGEILHPATDLVMSYTDGVALMKGWSDLNNAIDSEDATSVRTKLASLKPDEVGPFIQDLTLMGNITHGTHVAGIAAEGNPFVRLLPARLTFDFRQIPLMTPSEEYSKATAKMYADTVNYFKKQGVRVVNMSWGGDIKSIEAALEQKGVGATPEERQEIASKLFKIEAEALEAAMRDAPEILFVAAAGNSDNDNTFAQLIPSGFNLPNMLTIGAIDETGKPTSFTTFGKNVTLYANGFEVNSFVPGGQKVKFSGTSMAAPQLVNLVGKMLALKPGMTPAQVIDAVKNGAVPMEGYEGRFIIHQKRTIEKIAG